MKKIYKYISIGALAGFGVFSVCTLLPHDKKIMMNLNKEDTNYRVDYATNNDTNLPFNNLYAFEVKIKDEILKLPMKIEDLIQAGWICEKEIPSDPFDFVLFQHNKWTKDDTTISVYYDTLEEYPETMDSYYIHEIVIEEELNTNKDIYLPKHIQLGVSTLDDILKTYGDPHETIDSIEFNDIYLSYEYDIEQDILLTVDKNSKVLKTISLVYNLPKEKLTLPESLNNFTNTSELKNQLSASEFKVNNEVYSLPLPVSYLLNQGWKLSEVDETELISSNPLHLSSYEVSKENQRFMITVKNYDDEPKPILDCMIMEVEFINGNCDYELSGGLNPTTSLDELVSLLNDYKHLPVYSDDVLLSYRVKTSSSSQIEFIPVDNEIVGVMVSNFPKH